MDHNKEVLTQEGIKVSRAIFDKCLDPKLSTRLRNIQNENGKNMVKDDTPIQDCLKVLKNMLEAIPLWLRRLNYFNCSKNKNENVAQFWARKRDLASQCNLADLVVPDDIEVMELIRKVHAPQLRTKFLEVKDPKVPELLQIAANWQQAKDISKSMEEAAVKAARATSSYKRDKDEQMKTKVEDKSQSQSQNDQVCWGCGGKDVHSRKNKNKDKCPGMDTICSECQRRGHLAKFCLGKSQEVVNVKAGNDAFETCDKVEDDFDPIPMKEPKSKTTAFRKNSSTLERSYGPDDNDSETNPESDEPEFKPGAKVLIHNPKTKNWDPSVIVINWRSRMEPKESREGPYGMARDVTIITSSLLRMLIMLVKMLQTFPTILHLPTLSLTLCFYL